MLLHHVLKPQYMVYQNELLCSVQVEHSISFCSPGFRRHELKTGRGEEKDYSGKGDGLSVLYDKSTCLG